MSISTQLAEGKIYITGSGQGPATDRREQLFNDVINRSRHRVSSADTTLPSTHNAVIGGQSMMEQVLLHQLQQHEIFEVGMATAIVQVPMTSTHITVPDVRPMFGRMGLHDPEADSNPELFSESEIISDEDLWNFEPPRNCSFSDYFAELLGIRPSEAGHTSVSQSDSSLSTDSSFCSVNDFRNSQPTDVSFNNFAFVSHQPGITDDQPNATMQIVTEEDDCISDGTRSCASSASSRKRKFTLDSNNVLAHRESSGPDRVASVAEIPCQSDCTIEARDGYLIGGKHSKRSYGAFGVVMNARKYGRSYVAKFFGYTRSKPDSVRIQREIDNLRHLSVTDGVVQLISVFNDSCEGLLTSPLISKRFHEIHPVIVLEELSGGTLIDWILVKKTYFCEQDAATLFKSFMSSLDAVHKRNVIHCDLKVDNLMFQSGEPPAKLKIIDFGLAVNLTEGRSEYYDCRLFGTPSFMAPETILWKRNSGQAVYSRKSDIWQAGCILYILITGHYPYQHFQDCSKTFDSILSGQIWKPISSLEASDEVKHLLQLMLTEDPVHRIDTGAVLTHPWLEAKVCTLPGADYKPDFIALRYLMKHELERVLDIKRTHLLTGLQIQRSAHARHDHDIFLSTFRSLEALKAGLIGFLQTPQFSSQNEATTYYAGTADPVADDTRYVDNTKVQGPDGVCQQFNSVGLNLASRDACAFDYRDAMKRTIDRERFLLLVSNIDRLTHHHNAQYFENLDRRRFGQVDYLECLYGSLILEMTCGARDLRSIAKLFFFILDIWGRGVITSDMAHYGLLRFFEDNSEEGSFHVKHIRGQCEVHFKSNQLNESCFVESFVDLMLNRGPYWKTLSENS
jgi:serine/threonine protein kinase